MNSFIEHTKVYSLSWLLFYVCLGILCYVLDRQYMQGIYGWWYNMTHKHPLVKSRGFFYGQSTGKKVLMATVVSTVQSIYTCFFTSFHSNPLVETLLWFFEIPAMVFGLALAYWIWPWWQKRFAVYEGLDKLDEIIEKRHDQAEAEAARKEDGNGGSAPSIPVTSSVPPNASIPVAVAAQATTPVPEEDPRESIRQYGRGEGFKK